MSGTALEHVNVTVADPQATAEWMCAVLGWHKRWEGPVSHGGYSIHVGGPDSYLALNKRGDAVARPDTYNTIGGLNHIALCVDDLDAAAADVTAAGFTTHSHADYEPGRRFYFRDFDDIEYEIVSYS